MRSRPRGSGRHVRIANLIHNFGFNPIFCLYIGRRAMQMYPRARDSSDDWNRLFSNEALGYVGDARDRHKRARCVPTMYGAMLDRDVVSMVSELEMPPSILINHLLAIGWYGRLKFVERLAIAYNNKVAEIRK
jgi:hypothetical protein